MQESPKLYIDNWGKIYRNAIFKKTSLYIQFLNQSITRRKNLLQTLQSCTTHQCIKENSHKLDVEQNKFTTFLSNLNLLSQKIEHQVLLCVDLYVHNDILFCQNQARESLFKQMKEEYQKYTL